MLFSKHLTMIRKFASLHLQFKNDLWEAVDGSL